MSVRFHLSPSSELDECHAGSCPYEVHYDFFDDESASVCKICLELAKTAGTVNGILALLARAESGDQVRYTDITTAMRSTSLLSKPRERIGPIPVKTLAGLLYSMGRTFNGLQTDRLSTEEFLRTGSTAVLGSKSNAALLADLLDASNLVLSIDWSVTPIDVDLLKQINGRMTRTAALKPGMFRTTESAWVNTTLGRWRACNHPSENKVDEILRNGSKIATSNDATIDAASTVFCRIAKMQTFGDGNKRTALLLANAVMLKHRDDNRLLAVPADDEKVVLEFNEKLSEWYVNGDNGIIRWLADWNRRSWSSNSNDQ